jgi:hypothetical protein
MSTSSDTQMSLSASKHKADCWAQVHFLTPQFTGSKLSASHGLNSLVGGKEISRNFRSRFSCSMTKIEHAIIKECSIVGVPLVNICSQVLGACP